MRILIPITLFGWIPLVLVLFAVVRSTRRAVIVAFVFGWLFLPVWAYALPGLPDYTKMTATALGVLLGMLLVDPQAFFRVRPGWVDLPIILWCLVPAAASISNGLGLYDAASAVVEHVIIWGLPYFIGRVYFGNLPAIRELAIGIFVGGLIYMPLSLWEIRMSPQLNIQIYGFQQFVFAMTHRLGGFRPVVFLQDGLAVGMWMTMTALIGWWLWYNGKLKNLWGLPAALLVPSLLVTAVLCKSAAAIVLLLTGIAFLLCLKYLRTTLPILLLILAPVGYVGVRSAHLWSGQGLVQSIHRFAPDRAASLDFRFHNENLLSDKALKRPVFGWGRWSRSRVFNKNGHEISTTDGMWIIALGRTGFVGLASFLLVLLLPPAILFTRLPRAALLQPIWAAPVVLAMLLILNMVNNLLNAQINPVFILVAGGVTGIAAILVRRRVPMPAPARRVPRRPVSTAHAIVADPRS